MTPYDPGRYGLHGHAVIELTGAHGPASFFLPGLTPATGPADVTWEGDPAGMRPLVGDPRDPGPPRSHARVDGDGRWHLAGPGHDGRLPVQDVLLRAGATLLHGTALEVGGRGVLVLGPPGTGKTVLALAALTEPGWRLVADDVVVATEAGELLATEAPLALYPEHAALLPAGTGPRPGAKRAWRAVRDTPVIGPAARAAKRWAAGLGGPAGRWARSFEARFRRVAPTDLFPESQRAAAAPLEAVLALDPAAPPGRVEVTPPEHSAAVAVAEAYADGDLHAQLAAYGRAGVVDVAAHWAAAAAVIGAVAGAASRHAVLGVAPRADAGELLRRAREAVAGLLS